MNQEKEKETDINEILNEFYKLKDKYEKTYYEKYVKSIVRSENKSNKEKKREFSKLPKPPCINCQRNVGTIFSIIANEDEVERNFVIKCGDIVNPCPLDINFNYGQRKTYEHMIQLYTEGLENVKQKIINEKNNIIFGYTPSNMANNIFQDLSTELKENTDFTGFLIEKNILVNHNPAKKELLNKLEVELQNTYIMPFKNLVHKFSQQNNPDFIKEAVQIYVSEITPQLKQIQQLKYEVNFVEYNIDNSTFHLIQKPNSLENLQYGYSSSDKINAFVKGMKITGVQKTRKSTKSTKSTKSKTLKIKPTIELVEDEGEQKQQEQQQFEPDVPIFTETGVVWNKPEYIKLWNSLSDQFKKHFATQDLSTSDKEYLQEFMTNCVINKKTGQQCKIKLPKNTYFPPTITDDGLYDFGSGIINKLFNGLRKNYQETLLTLYTEKDGVKNYDMLIDALEKQLQYAPTEEFKSIPIPISSKKETIPLSLEDTKQRPFILPPPWEVRFSQTYNKPYYYNPETKEGLWEPPFGDLD